MGIFIEHEELKEIVNQLEEVGVSFIMLNRQLTEKSIKWLQENGYYIKIAYANTCIAKEKEELPSHKTVRKILEETEELEEN